MLEEGGLRIEREGDGVVLRYEDRAFPIAIASLAPLIGRAADRAGSDEAREVAGLAEALPDIGTDATAEERLERHRRKEHFRERIARLCADDELAPVIDREVARINGDPDGLDALLRRQRYRIAYWRTAARELDHRRFFDINDLVGLRVEDPEVFAAVHERVLGWLADGAIGGSTWRGRYAYGRSARQSYSCCARPGGWGGWPGGAGGPGWPGPGPCCIARGRNSASGTTAHREVTTSLMSRRSRSSTMT